ncbi:MAG: hypothetical protein JKY65_12495 [Planctomycetes bacterium]|nr:hypothetical protein [Planctomycetota bacterium]
MATSNQSVHELAELQEHDPKPLAIVVTWVARLLGLGVILFPFGVVVATGSAPIALFAICTAIGCVLIFHTDSVREAFEDY